MPKKRQDIGEEYKWKLSDIYPDEKAWYDDYSKVERLLGEMEKYKGKLGSSARELYEAIKLSEEIERRGEKLYVYARMKRDEDNTLSSSQVLCDKAEMLGVKVNSQLSFMIPEMMDIPDEVLDKFLEEPELALYKHYFDELRRKKEHILSANEEKILAMTADLSTAPSQIFNMLNNADIKFPVIKDEEGKEVELTKANFGRFMESPDREVRKEAFKALYSSYAKLKNTLGATLNSSIKRDIFYARVRQYSSALEASLDGDNVKVEVYENLIATVHKHIGALHKYIALRKKVLGVDELHMYDLYVPLVKEYKKEYDYNKAKELVLEGLKVLGDDYVNQLKKGMENGWIDVYENEGKTGGAYSWGCYDSHPYVLLNYDNRLDDVFTLAHEMGHALHSYYSNTNQPYVYSQYPILLAEVASTVNESLLLDYMLKNTNDEKEKLYLINHYLEEFRGTVYRQTMFAEFEKIVHEKVEKGEPVTVDEFCKIYRELNRFYYGDEVVLDDEISLEWARIPHFYSAFYVYKYATGFSAATAIKEDIKEGGREAVERYMEFLKAGGSDYPLNILKRAGVDLTTPEPIEKALNYFASLVEEMEKLVK
ncbi:oligopeptidase F. Metallo peptidase. MEROPS family M03B [Thermosyntropha lipolytica DSM 11003]|uniref:Oligopeptidase F n=1 Tax=Thermosyntropha lipolytica DSM 11003 TaxID=1123382 RepID=A0A1M5PSL5_9FIRM|nr:oligoendopeptidase F [Thermosyntropha lipolytica]SHH04937.1 oligopeptidase F. Metallo peptidase. MEROPS family M03B [Thermosyntropha lipolytica DSM 11003]